jgi:hypothetical protein
VSCNLNFYLGWNISTTIGRKEFSRVSFPMSFHVLALTRHIRWTRKSENNFKSSSNLIPCANKRNYVLQIFLYHVLATELQLRICIVCSTDYSSQNFALYLRVLCCILLIMFICLEDKEWEATRNPISSLSCYSKRCMLSYPLLLSCLAFSKGYTAVHSSSIQRKAPHSNLPILFFC